jgi:hypothetical protein
MARLVSVTLRAMPDSDADAAKIIEILSRASVGIAMDGTSCDLQVVPYEHGEGD